MDMHMRKMPMEELVQLIGMQLSKGGRATLTVTGCSMLPMLRSYRDTVELIPVTQRRKKGDIVLYRRENGCYVLHRIVALDGESYICCGDNQAAKERVDHNQLIAVVDAFVKNGKKYTLDMPGYRAYVRVWVGLFPLRPYYIAIRRRIGRLRRRY